MAHLIVSDAELKAISGGETTSTVPNSSDKKEPSFHLEPAYSFNANMTSNTTRNTTVNTTTFGAQVKPIPEVTLYATTSFSNTGDKQVNIGGSWTPGS